MSDIVLNTLSLYLDAAPWLLLGLVAAGLIKAWISESWMARWLGGEGLGPVTRAALIGAPLPLCSCGVLPAALSLRRGGASRGSTLSFLIATPETGVDSVAVTYALMGPFMAITRPLAAIYSAILTGLLGSGIPEKPLAAPAAGCCSSGCCGDSAPSARLAPRQRTLAGLRYAMTDILDDLAPWLGFGIAAAGILISVVPADALAEWGSGPAAMLVMLGVGIPLYICATASTPLAASLLLLGISPGTVLVFLLAGPATNLATLGLLRRELGARVLAGYLGGIAFTSLTAGLVVDGLVARFDIDIPAQVANSAEWLPSWIGAASGLLLLLFALRPLRRRLLSAPPAAEPVCRPRDFQ